MEKARVELDRLVCIGAGNCVRAAPGAFALDDDAIAEVVDLSTASESQLRQAERDCPSGAIWVLGESD